MMLVTFLSSRFTPHSIEDILGREERQTILGREKTHFVLGRGEEHILGRKDDHSILVRGEKRGREVEAVRHNKVRKFKFLELKIENLYFSN